ncbi:MAG: peptidylprolyl isomerase [Bacteroidaceae bacterium]|nr:peptidylprolyl isomerase [Bacteroidaceae bacterium]
MKKIFVLMLWACCLVCAGCTSQQGEKETEVVLETTVGEIRLKLYNDTPGHRDNFVQNVKDGLYTGVTFHRVIRNFMIQTGDPKTRPQGYEVKLNEQGDTIPEWIPAEIVWPKHFHVRGMLAAAREGDEENPKRMSDKFEFYIVTGKVQSDDDMDNMEKAREQRDAELLYQQKQLANKEKLEALRAARDRDGLSDLLEKLQDEAKWEVSENPPITYPKDVRKAYRVHGGAPWLDNEYTVFGEVVKGMDAVETIQKVKTDATDKPLKEIRIVKAYVVE